jgi:hypothetical protein
VTPVGEVTLKQLLECDPSVFDAAADAWASFAKGLDDAAEQFIRGTMDLSHAWPEGADAQAACAQNARLRAQVSNAEDPARRTGEALRVFAGTLRGLKRLAWDIVQDAQRNGYTVDSLTGTVTRAAPVPAGTSVDQVQRAVQARANEIRSLLDQADAADAEVVRKINAERPDPGSGFGLVSAKKLAEAEVRKQRGKSPKEVKVWWDGLAPEQQEQAIRDYPHLVGWLDGVPAEDRDVANRLRLDRDQASLTRQASDLEAKVNAMQRDPWVSTFELAEVQGKLDTVREKLAGLDTVERRLGKLGGNGFLLGIDPAGDGKAIVAVGNPDLADNIATFVPGTGAGVNGGGFAGNLDRTEAMSVDAENAAAGERTSVVLWVGYDAPDNPLFNSPFSSYADDAAPDLRRFQGGLRASHEAGDANQTVIGHSYGTTVIGHAASDGKSLDADQVVFVASPGVGVDQASDLSLRHGDHSGQNVWATRADNDVIRLSPVHNNDPVESDFHGRAFASDPGSPWHQLDAHGSYWNDGNIARDHMANLIVGNSDAVSRPAAPDPGWHTGPPTTPAPPPTPPRQPTPNPSSSPGATPTGGQR